MKQDKIVQDLLTWKHPERGTIDDISEHAVISSVLMSYFGDEESTKFSVLQKIIPKKYTKDTTCSEDIRNNLKNRLSEMDNDINFIEKQSLANVDKKVEEKFSKKAKSLGYKVEQYSGKCMFGRKCPSVKHISDPNKFIKEMKLKNLLIDNIGLNYVVYTG